MSHVYAKRVTVIAAIAFAMILTSSAGAQQFPTKPVHVLQPYATGGLVDAVVRAVTQPMQESLGQPFLVESRPGGATFIAMQACAQAAPDGYTICVTTPDSLSYNPFLFSKVPYDAEKDFVPVTNLTMSDGMVVAPVGAPFNTFLEMIAYAKANPGKVTLGTWGPGSIPDVYLAAIKKQYGVDISGVAFRGAGPALAALLGGEIHLTFGGLGFYTAQIQAGKLKPIATTPERLLPGVPSMKELGAEPGLPAYFGVFAPAKTPMPIVEKLATEFAKSLQTPKVQEFLKAQALHPVGNSPAEFAAFVKSDRANAERAFKSMDLKPLDAP